MAASYAISWMEGWTIFDAFYFLISSVLTIGFGDLVPVNDKFVLVTLLIVLIGLVLTTTCVDIVGAYYIDKLHFFGRRLDSEPKINIHNITKLKSSIPTFVTFSLILSRHFFSRILIIIGAS
uniref:Potassium channel domain-containing protein n=1 Tax=Panagrolaimus davidi TaxID=227884 RepID=A0A914R004_9BILA